METLNSVKTTLLNVVFLANRWGAVALVAVFTLRFLHEVKGEQVLSLAPYFVGLGLFSVLVFLLERKFRWAGFALLAASLHTLGVPAPTLTEDPSRLSNSDHCLKTLTINAYIANQDQEGFAELARNKDADLVLVTELGPELHAILHHEYPYSHTVSVGATFGMGVYSRLELQDPKVIRRGRNLPRIEFNLHSGEQSLRGVLVHPSPPSSAEALQDRNDLISELAEDLKSETQPTLIAGDFNAVHWSKAMAPLTGAMQRADTGGTWPRALGLRIPIDHVFVKGLSHKSSHTVVEDLGSDHLPIFAEICF